MKYLPLVWSALLRRPAETVFTWLAVTAGFTLFASMIGLNVTYQRAIEGAREDRLIVVMRFFTALSGLPIGLEERLKRMPGVSAAGAWASVCGHHQDEQHFACVITADEGMREAFPFPIDSVHWNLLMASVDGVLVSHKAAQFWRLKPGDVFALIVGAGVRADGSNSWPFKVLAIVPDSPERAHGYMVGNIKYFQNNRPVESRALVGGFRLKLREPDQLNAVARQIDHFFANSGTPTASISAREDAANAYRSVVNMALLTRLIAAAGLFMILFLTANVIARAVDERISEFGVLLAVGFTKAHLLGLVFAEAAILCLLGAAVGNGIAAGVTRLPARLVPSGLGIPESTVSAAVWAASLAAAAVLALLSAGLPLFRLWYRTPAQLLSVH
ncbi:MAG: FtsX-like permease family protein [Sinobacteraceae bacterium]|nr:FtsX-like permease family protein [Nevskiaceae bacterium]